MVDSFASGKTQAVEPSFGSYVDTWQLPVNANFGTFDAAVSGTTTIDVTSVVASNPYINITFSEFNATTNPTPWTQPNAGQNLRINLTGGMTFNITVLLQPVAGFWIFSNNTVGNFSIIVGTSAGGGSTVTIPRGYNSVVFSDGQNVVWADNGNVVANVPQAIPAGAIIPFAMASAPSGWLICDGTSISRTTYAALFAAIGTTWGPGDGSTTFSIPNFSNGAFLRNLGGNAAALGTFQADGVGPLTINDPGHLHSTGQAFGASGGGHSDINGNTQFVTQTGTAVTGITITNTIVETRPVNYSVNYCIKI